MSVIDFDEFNKELASDNEYDEAILAKIASYNEYVDGMMDEGGKFDSATLKDIQRFALRSKLMLGKQMSQRKILVAELDATLRKCRALADNNGVKLRCPDSSSASE